jgi:hypothetical protein
MNLIKIRVNNTWIDASEDQKINFINYKHNTIIIERPYTYNIDNIEYSINRSNDNYNKGIVLHNINDDVIIPIADWSNVKVFLVDQENVNWYSARNYQIWAYYNYIYDDQQIKSYKSKDTIGYDDYIEIDIDGLEANIIFSISRNENSSIYYQKNDINRTKINISDSEIVRHRFLGYYNRIFNDISGFISVRVEQDYDNITKIILPSNITLVETNIDDLLCITCNIYKQNIQFKPCNHTIICSDCFPRLINKEICSLCRQNINLIIPYDTIIPYNEN